MHIGLNLKQLREHYQETRLSFSQRLTIDNSQYSKIEKGSLLPTLTQIMELSSNYPEVNLNWLLKSEAPMLKSEIKNNDPPDCSQYKEEITQLLKEVSELKSQIISLQAEQLHFKKVPEPKPKQPATQLKTHTK